jgi:hypothetical protein
VLEDIVLYMEDILQSPKEYTKKVILTHTIIKILKLEIKLQFKKAPHSRKALTNFKRVTADFPKGIKKNR